MQSNRQNIVISNAYSPCAWVDTTNLNDSRLQRCACDVFQVQSRERSRSPLNLTVSPSSRRSTAASTPTAPSPTCSESSSAIPNPVKTRLQDFFNACETSVGVVEVSETTWPVGCLVYVTSCQMPQPSPCTISINKLSLAAENSRQTV